MRPLRSRSAAVTLDADPVANIPAAVWLAERRAAGGPFEVGYVNRAGIELLGYDREAWCGTPEFWIATTHADDRVQARRQLQQVEAHGEACPIAVRWLRADGSEMPVEVHLAAVMAADGTLAGVRGFALDASRFARVQDDLARTRELLAYASRRATLNGLVESLVHELHQPLSAILNNAEAARMALGARAGEARDIAPLIDDIIAANARAEGIIRRARGLAGPSRGTRRPVDLNGIVVEACDLLASEALVHGAVLSPRLAASPCPVAAERVELLQVLLNLAGNALDAVSCVAAGTRTVEIEVIAASPDAYVVAVTDTGPGIPPRVLPRIFEPLVSTKAEGLGLGLDIASAIVAAHGGRTWAGNNRCGGAHFVVKLPRAHAEAGPRGGTARLC